MWFVDRNFVGDNSFKSGPGAYDHQDYKNKQSWNKGKVPFGSGSMFDNGQFFNPNAKKGVRSIPTINETNPGPGQYNF